MFVLTVDQVASRRGGDAVDEAVRGLAEFPTVLAFTRTVGDELQGVLDDPLSVADAILWLMRSPFRRSPGRGRPARWHIGLGVGPVELPLPEDSRRARGPAFVSAREAVERAKTSGLPVCVRAPDAPERAHDAETALLLIHALWERRSGAGWEAVRRAGEGAAQAEIAAELGISRQAVSQRLSVAGFALDDRARELAGRLVAIADREQGDSR